MDDRPRGICRRYLDIDLGEIGVGLAHSGRQGDWRPTLAPAGLETIKIDLN